ncbi:MAG: signal recognition particle-docking protein FtsY [Crenarchaeota archaeon]|nr:signal recognition particle-docking protein FtsY [Thermoproteota archaeon]MCR8453771.1 signal recognition particle-docking protein FtsY [Thermoproteota archaeon]MCR8455131.1 signal recognition particle-docking protein FtsY [Thermoproteota archaeon]MCR8462845.1 signal recognition particle-docking protein FtsY [Thermoproteota archaeon]MCR8470955.1 signal recognition particle-docking protein FtsY [Thermoproteota archaeon]
MFDALRRAVAGLVEKIAYKELSESDLTRILFEFELNLIAADVAASVASEISKAVLNKLKGQTVGRFSDTRKLVLNAVREELSQILAIRPLDILKKIQEQRNANLSSSQWKPFVIVFLGPNGSGKTTTIAKIANLLKKSGFSVVLACSDTFRAGAIEQLEEHAKRLGIRMIKREYGADPASVCFDAIAHAVAKKIDVVLIDTAGRLATDVDLIAEMQKIVRVSKPDIRCLVVDALMGNDLVVQAELFNNGVGIDCSVLTKVDADVKGGAAITLIHVTKKPIEFIGVGQKYEDLKKFEHEWFLEKIIGEL